MGSAMAITPLRPLRIERAPAWGRYCSSSIAASTRARVSGEIDLAPLSTYDTVLRDTPASLATSAIVDGIGKSSPYRRTVSMRRNVALVFLNAQGVSRGYFIMILNARLDCADLRENAAELRTMSGAPPEAGMQVRGGTSTAWRTDSITIVPSACDVPAPVVWDDGRLAQFERTVEAYEPRA
jgi:hypothetical protein